MQAMSPSKTTYALVTAALMLLLAATVGAAMADLGRAKEVVNLGIAAIKATLVVLFFMHIRYEQPVMRLFAAAGLFWLAIMISLTLADFLTRTS